jgi:hypothetical protein
MKNAPAANSNESAPDKRDSTPGTFPKRRNTVTADVLAALMESKVITGMDSVFAMSTTRLAAFICRLGKRYGWTIERHDVAAGTNDGRESWVTAYWLPPTTIARAFALGAREWVDGVKAASAERRKLAGKCKTEAAKKNAIRNKLRPQDPRQGRLWDDM